MKCTERADFLIPGKSTNRRDITVNRKHAADIVALHDKIIEVEKQLAGLDDPSLSLCLCQGDEEGNLWTTAHFDNMCRDAVREIIKCRLKLLEKQLEDM